MILLFGGSFDPVHRGHRETAEAAQQLLQASELVWLPNYRSPLKTGTCASATQRETMLRRLLTGAGRTDWSLDTTELHAQKPAYTIDSLRRWRRQIGPDRPLTFLIGTDSWLQLTRWRDWRQLTTLAHLAVMRREPAGSLPAAQQNWWENHHVASVELLQSRPFGGIVLLDTPVRPISSSLLRTWLAASPADRRQALHWLDDPVRDYILHNGLYRQENLASS